MIKKVDFKKIGIVTLSATILAGGILPSISHAQKTNSIQITTKGIKNISELEKALEKEGVTKAELLTYVTYVKEEVAKQSTERGIVGTIKGAIKFIVKHADTIPIKSVRDAMKKYGDKVIIALDKIKVWTWYGIANGLTKVGIPDKYADLIADFIVTFIL